MYERVINFYTRNSIRAIEEKCNRCNGDNIMIDYNEIKYCLDCYQFQEINSEKFLLREFRQVNDIKPELVLKFKLSSQQNLGSKFLENCYKKRKNAFLQAVCGAGKTEIVLSTILTALTLGERVCFIVPRVEIIKQVSERMKSYFPKTKILTLFGGNNIVDDSPLVISTPQQLIKFYQEFDLIIIDEVDAFPYINNPFLDRLVQKSKKLNAIEFQMSATITKKITSLINNNFEYYLIAQRYHNRDLAIPKFIKSNSFFDAINLNLILKYDSNNKPLIIYVSSIKKGYILKSILNKKNINVAIITSESKYKKTLIKDFQNLKYTTLISTTILERGVTFPRVNVLVLEADQEIFNEATLIQIAGRVGRNLDEGEIIFSSKFISDEMVKAKKTILEFNRRKQ